MVAIAVFADVDSVQIRRVLETLGDDRKALRNVMRRASGRAATAVKTFVGRRIRDDLNIKKRDLERTAHQRGQKALFTTRVKEEGKRTIFSKVVLSEENRPPLRVFGARNTKRGVSYKIARNARRSRIAKAFGADDPKRPKLAGHVFVRTGQKGLATTGRYAGRVRERIRKLYGASPWGAYMTRDHGPEVQRIATETLEKRIEHEVEFELTRRGANRG